uniref:MG2 domain-containing protein n=1 Tax=Strongyloides venezuelensis TaxID=75913 RepID=A0A0K0FMK1_STRVS
MFNLLFLNFLKNFIILFTILILFVFVNGYDVSPDKKFLIVAPDFIPWRGIGKFIILPGWNLEENDNYQLTYSIYNNENDKNIVENSSISLSSKELTLLQIQNLPTHNIYLFNFEIDGKKESFKIYGGVNIKHIYIQSDKKIYRPNEKVRIVALPIKDDGTIYNYPLIFSILDSRKVKTVIQKVYYSWKGNFYHYEFTLPKYNCSGRWTILVHPTSSYNIPSHHFNTTIFVQDYVLPMYNFFIDVKPTNDEFIYEINVLAKHSIGKNAIGNIEIEGICDNKNTITLIGPEVS